MDGKIHQSTKGLFAIVNQIGWELLLFNETSPTYFSGGSRPSGKGGSGHPDPEIRGGGQSPKNFFPLFEPQFGLKIKGGRGLGPCS